MKLIEGFTKKVDYFGVELYVPKDHNFIAVDANGWVHSYKIKPANSNAYWLSYDDDDRNQYGERLGTVDLEGLDWRETLKAI